MTDRAHSCRFCEIVRNAERRSAVDEPWMANAQYMAISSVGALVPGWTLIVPLAHRLNLAASVKEDAFLEFAHVVVGTIEAVYGACAIFEHGSIEESSPTSCGTAHAHIHVVPMSSSLESLSREFDKVRTWEACGLMNLESASAGKEYLYAADRFAGIDTLGSLSVLSEGTSQFFRKVIASHQGRPEQFDYRAYPQLETALATTKVLSRSVNSISQAA